MPPDAKETAQAPEKSAPSKTGSNPQLRPDKAVGPTQLFRATNNSSTLRPVSRARVMHSLQRTVGNTRIDRHFVQRQADDRQAESSVPKSVTEVMPTSPGPPLDKSVRQVGTVIQTKLAVGAVDNPHEHEADRVAETITQFGSKAPPSAQRQVVIKRSLSQPARVATAPAQNQEPVDAKMEQRITSPTGGQRLPEGIQREMEAGLGADFSEVRVHDNAEDQGDAADLSAKAFTFGNHIWLGAGQSANDRRLMAHELTHVVQQGGVSSPDTQAIQRDGPDAGVSDAGQTSSTSATQPNGTRPGNSADQRNLAYAVAVLRRVQPLPASQQARLEEMIGNAPIYEMIEERNEKRELLDSARDWLTLFEIFYDEDDPDPRIALWRRAVETLPGEIEQLNRIISTALQALGIETEEQLVSLVEEFPAMWIARAKDIAIAALQENYSNVLRERNRYRENVCSTDTEGLRAADEHLKRLSDEAEAALNHVRIVEHIASIAAPSGGVDFHPQYASSYQEVIHLEDIRRDLAQKQAELEAQRQSYGRLFPILLVHNYTPGVFANAPPEQLASLTGEWLDEILENIVDTVLNIWTEKIKVWDLPNIAELTYLNMGVPADSPLRGVLGKYIEGEESDSFWLGIAQAVFEIGAVIVVSIVATPLAGAAVGGLFTLNHLADDINTYLAESAASHVAMDPVIADISANEPQLGWIILDVVSLGLDVGTVAAALRPAARIVMATGELAEFAETARRVAPQAAEELIARAERYAAVEMASKGAPRVATPRVEALHQLLEEARSGNILIKSDEEAVAYLDAAARRHGIPLENMHAVTIGDVIMVRPQYADNVRILREELIHVFQQRGGIGSASIVEGEIEARLAIIRFRHTWGITNDEVREMIREIREMRRTGRY